MLQIMTDDPERDFDRYMRAQDEWLERRPKCDCCEEHIREEMALHYVTNEVDIWLCQSCIEDNMEYIEVD